MKKRFKVHSLINHFKDPGKAKQNKLKGKGTKVRVEINIIEQIQKINKTEALSFQIFNFIYSITENTNKLTLVFMKL